MKNKIIELWHFYKKTLIIAIPIMIQNIVTNFVSLIDNIMVGQVGTEQMSGVAIVNQILFVFNVTMFGVTAGAGIFGAQFFGKKDYDGVRHTFRYKIISSMIITALGIGIFLVFGDKLISMFLHDTKSNIDIAATFGYAKEYMAIMLIGLIPYTLEQVYSSTLREGGNTTMPMIAGVVAVIINTVLNYLLIFGIGIFPQMGVVGAAIATVISRFVQTGIVILWMHLNSSRLEYVKGIYKSFKIPKDLVKNVTIKGLIPLTVNECLWSAGFSAMTQAYSMRGIEVVAALNITSTVTNIFNVLFISFGSGIAIVIGQMLGARRIDEAKRSAPRLIIFSASMCVVVGIIMAAFSGMFPQLYNTTSYAKELAKMLIIINAVYMPMQAAVHASYFVIRSGGKTMLTFMFDSLMSWLCMVPVAYCISHFTNMPIIPMYIICNATEVVKLILAVIIIKKGTWMSNIVDKN